jgi:hypothetical protein
LNVTIFTILLAATIGGMVWINYRFSVDNPGGNDFLARWMGAHMWLMEGLSPYDFRVSEASQVFIYGRPALPENGEDVAHFVYPMYSMVFFAPFGLLEYVTARTIWMTLLEVCAIGLVIVGLRAADWKPNVWLTALLFLFSLVWYHGTRTIIIGQFAGINAFLIILALYWIKEGQDVPAGVVLALTTAKPQMVFLLVPFVLLWAFSHRRLGILGGFFIALGSLLAVSFALIPDWYIQMARQVLDYPNYTNIGSPLSIIAAGVPGIRDLLNGVLHIVLSLYLIIEWVLAWRKDTRWFLWTAFMTLVVTNLVAPRTATTNYVMLLPVLLLIFRIWAQRWKRGGVWAAGGTLLLLFAGLWALFLATVQGNTESALMYLPLPFICLFTLWWMRWWALRPPKLMFEGFSAQLG